MPIAPQEHGNEGAAHGHDHEEPSVVSQTDRDAFRQEAMSNPQGDEAQCTQQGKEGIAVPGKRFTTIEVIGAGN